MGRISELKEALAVSAALLSGSEEHVVELTAEVKRLRRVNRELDQTNRTIALHADELLKRREVEHGEEATAQVDS